MGKIFIEDEEIAIYEKKVTEDGEHVIEKNNYVMRSVTRTEFKSPIFYYGENENVLIGKINRFNEDYYKIVIFKDDVQKAWKLIELPVKLEIRVKRLGENNYLVIGDNKQAQDITAQVSFCKLKPSTRVEEITINFSKLNAIHYISKNSILLYYDDFDPVNGKTSHTLAMYTNEGVCKKTVYEYYDGDATVFNYKLEDNKIIVLQEDGKKDKN